MNDNNKIDIYDENLFEIKNFNWPEQSDLDITKVCRWSEGKCSVSPKIKVKNVCIHFNSKFQTDLTFLITNSIKDVKHDFKLHKDSEYILYIPLIEKDNILFFIDTYIPYQNGDSRKLGLYVRKIYVSNEHYDSINLIKLSDQNSEEFFLLEKNDHKLEIPITPLLDEISIFNQKENVEIFELDYKKTNLHYNSAIFTHNQNKYLLTRKSSFVLKNTTINTLNLFEFNTKKQIDLDIIDELEYEQYEDPRVLSYDNKLYVSCANYTHDYKNFIHQKILIFDNEFKHIGNIHPQYGYNGKSLHQNKFVEKNWIFFINDGKLMCVYKMFPHTVVEFDWNGNLISEYKSFFDVKSIWKYGECRGGSNPVLKDGYYHSFFHSSLPWKSWQRRYFMGYYKFESKPPFKIVEISKEPILWGNTIDVRDYPDTSPLVVFPCGAIVENDKFLVSFGLNDERSGIIII